jgi:dipeptidyl aminopeptidase/acylaminoacyl peptidase
LTNPKEPEQVAGRTRNGAPRAVAELPKGVGDANRPRRQTHALTIEQAAAVEAPREFRLSPDGRRVAFTFEAGGARQLFVMPIRGGYPEQITASEKACLDPQWSPDGRRLAFVRDEAIWMVDVEGSHEAVVAQHPAGNRSPRWCADGHQIAFISRRRGWDQLWVVEAPVPRPAGHPASLARAGAADQHGNRYRRLRLGAGRPAHRRYLAAASGPAGLADTSRGRCQRPGEADCGRIGLGDRAPLAT